MQDNRLGLKTNMEARHRAGELVSQRLPFSNHTGSFRGIVGRPDTLGWLPEEWRKVWDKSRVMYTIMSFDTPIAWLKGTGEWVVPPVSYSTTTSRQQTIMRVYLLTGEQVAA
jgi:hypothetical protein